ncbi:glycosyltransferase family 2 protein [Pedobacter sp. SYSU D00535]|uniref:glycosyltransferase family 2 protein n=1 Tax=Pedobacter sp. SYSU D00535 TaxID=2810308 RepID=UPI001A958DD1|nr:glycosyltransferase family 2 protein [Pedobacter sp. SYSU D00535]
MKKVSVITVNYNQPKVTEELLQSIFSTNTYPDIEILVVDNGSKTNSVPEWNQKYPDVRFIRSEENLGFAGGNNLAIKAAKGDYLFLVNNDTEFTAGLIEALVRILDQNQQVGMVSPKIRFHQQPDTLQYAGFTSMNFNTARNACIGEFEKDKGQYDDKTGPTGFIHGAAVMVRQQAIAKAGLMAEHFFLYYEEMDWCERVKRAGYEVWVEPKALIYHKESISVGKKSPLKEFFMNRNRILFIRRNAPAISRLIFYFHFCALVTPRNLLNYFKEGRTDLAPQLLKAIWWNLRHSKNSTDLGYPLNKI